MTEADSQTQRFVAALESIRDDPEAIALVRLLMLAFKRKDTALAQGLQDLAAIGKKDGEPVELTDDDLADLPRLNAVCEREDEARAWGRALAHACMRGDRLRVALLLGLIARRCAA